MVEERKDEGQVKESEEVGENKFGKETEKRDRRPLEGETNEETGENVEGGQTEEQKGGI